jgi:hypothetical protein
LKTLIINSISWRQQSKSPTKRITICPRNLDAGTSLLAKIQSISDRILPDNISSASPKILNHQGIVVGIFNPVSSVMVHEVVFSWAVLLKKMTGIFPLVVSWMELAHCFVETRVMRKF